MVERIRTLLETRQLTPTQFADAIGVARPIVSHILSGRNKPSLEVVQRILAAMPDLSMPWLLNGTGPMQATAPAASPSRAASNAVESATVTPPAQETIQDTSVPPAATGRASAGNQRRPAPSGAPSMLTPSATAAGPRRFTAAAPKPSPIAASAVEALPAALPEAPAPQAEPVTAPVTAPKTAPGPVLDLPLAAMPDEKPPVPDNPASSGATAAALFAGAEKPIRRIVIFYRDGSFADYQPE